MTRGTLTPGFHFKKKSLKMCTHLTLSLKSDKNCILTWSPGSTSALRNYLQEQVLKTTA